MPFWVSQKVSDTKSSQKTCDWINAFLKPFQKSRTHNNSFWPSGLWAHRRCRPDKCDPERVLFFFFFFSPPSSSLSVVSVVSDKAFHLFNPWRRHCDASVFPSHQAAAHSFPSITCLSSVSPPLSLSSFLPPPRPTWWFVSKQHNAVNAGTVLQVNVLH